ncbi:MAG: hypothetical protein AB1664_01490 [Thermodesulfobacteriota bacterium]
MTMSRSHAFGLWARAMALLLVTGVVSPNMIWCHESDGRINLEYGHCMGVHGCDSASQSSSVTKSFEEVCDSCFDIPLFTVGPNQNYSHLLTGLIVEMVHIAPLYLPADESDMRPMAVPSGSFADTYRFLPSVQSTVLLI